MTNQSEQCTHAKQYEQSIRKAKREKQYEQSTRTITQIKINTKRQYGTSIRTVKTKNETENQYEQKHEQHYE